MRFRDPVLALALLLLAGALFSGCATNAGSKAAPSERSPNIVVIMADDLGYGELGSYGQTKIQTPHLDQMARGGRRFTQFYSGSPVCAPSRATLLTGQHTGHTYIRDNYGLGGFRDEEERGQLALPAGTKTMGTLLQEAGYATAAIGKWGLGGPASEGLPTEHGFDFFYGYLDQKQAHNYYPTHLWRGTEGEGAVVWDTLANAYFSPHQRLERPPGGPSAYDAYKGTDYAPDLMHQQALSFIRRHQDEPFFLYRAPIIPHVALQVPDEALGAYEDFEETPYLGQDGYLPHPRPHAAYAGMISRLDQQVGEVLALLDSLGLGENTLVIFTSDNGPTYTGGVDYTFFDSNGPLRGLKGSVYEGGLRVPMIARWPGHIPPGTTSDQVGALWDLLPTAAEVAGAAAPGGLDGVSLLPALQQPGAGGEAAAALENRPPLYWEYFGLCDGQQALRRGRWKAVRLGVSKEGAAPLELYDVEADPGETNNVAAGHPELVQRLWQAMQQARTPSALERWHVEEAEHQPPAARETLPHPCFPWIEES